METMALLTCGRKRMVQIEQLAVAALKGDALGLRAMAQDWLAENPRISDCAPPASQDMDVVATAAALVELLALRAKQPAPSWTERVGSVRSPLFLVTAARTMPRLRQACERESPLPLRKRGLYAPADYLSFA
jgi:hypothetical protein